MILREGYTDQGTGSTFSSLVRKELIEHAVIHVNTLLGRMRLPQVKLTTWGRKVARTGLGEVAPKQLPKGTLREWHWEALVLVWVAGDKGLGKEETGNYGRKSWNTWLRLRDYEPSLVEERHYPHVQSVWTRGRYKIHITEAGKQFYQENWAKYVELYPDIDAPKPNNYIT